VGERYGEVTVGVFVSGGGLLWLVLFISYILVSGYYYVIYRFICFGKIVVSVFVLLISYTVKPRFTNASDHEQFGLRTDFPNTKRLG
jgi:hypothetical protein